jgi:hypothetical protein
MTSWIRSSSKPSMTSSSSAPARRQAARQAPQQHTDRTFLVCAFQAPTVFSWWPRWSTPICPQASRETASTAASRTASAASVAACQRTCGLAGQSAYGYSSPKQLTTATSGLAVPSQVLWVSTIQAVTRNPLLRNTFAASPNGSDSDIQAGPAAFRRCPAQAFSRIGR